MFPILATLLITGSVILMVLWEFHPLIREKVFPYIIDLLSVAEEKQDRLPIFLARTNFESEYDYLAKRAEKIVWLALTNFGKTQFKKMVSHIDDQTILRLILANKSNIETIRSVVKQVEPEVEIIHRPRIHFEMLVTENKMALWTADLASNGPKEAHDLTIISSDQTLVKEAQQYLAAFHEGTIEYPKDDKIYTLSSDLPKETKSIFINTSNGLNDLVQELLSSAKDSVLLVSPHITNDVAEHILNIIPRDVQVRFITWVDWQHWVTERSNPEALEILLSDRVIIDNCPHIQANCIIVDNHLALISSQNLTATSWFSKDEAGIYTSNEDLIKTIQQRIESWQPKQRFTMELLENEIANFDSFLKKDTAPLSLIPDEPEKDVIVYTDADELITPPLLGFSTLKQSKHLITALEDKSEKRVQVPISVQPDWIQDIVYIGTKRTIEYVRACQHQIKRKGSVTIRARGRLIYRAVDVAEQLRMLEELELILNKDSISIETYYPTGKETKWGGISQIAITLHQKN